MTATPADIAKFTRDGLVLTSNNEAGQLIKAEHIDARDLGDGEIEMFFDQSEHGQIMMEERFRILSSFGQVHEGIEVEEDFGLGTEIPLTPSVPCFRVIDASRDIDAPGRLRAYVHDFNSDRFSLELYGVGVTTAFLSTEEGGLFTTEEGTGFISLEPGGI